LIGVAGFGHLLLFGILIPIAAIRSKKFLDRIIYTPRRRYFVSMQVGILALISLTVARLEFIPLFPRALPRPGAILAGALFLAIALAFGWTRWTKAVKERKPVIALFMPLNETERGLWVVSAALAGFGEEVTWRGVQIVLLDRVIGNFMVAVAICVVMFAIAHAIQGWTSTITIGIFAAAFHALVWFSGSLYVGMLVHFIYDLIAGFAYAYLARKLGYFAERTSAADPAHPATQTI